MLPNDTTPQYHGSGPRLPGEGVHQALGENTTMSLAGHLLNQPAQGVSGPLPGHGFENEPIDAEHAAQQTYTFNDAANQVRGALRPSVPGTFTQTA